MYHFVFLLCTFIVPFTQSFTVVNNVEDDISIDDVSDYEVVPVRHMLHKPSINELTLHTKINGVERELYLQPTEGLLAGTGTKVFTAQRGYQRNVYFQEIPNVMNNIFINFYQDPTTYSSVTHSVNKYGKSEFNGIINKNMVIRPLPKKFRQRRDLLKSNTSSFESVADGFIDTTEHIIYKQTFNNAFQVATPKMDNRFSNIHRVSRSPDAELPDIVYPEILVFIDDVLFRKLEFNLIRAVEYTLSFWNGVDLRFREFEEPKIRLNIAGIVLIKETLPFLSIAIGNHREEKINTNALLEAFREFLQKDKFIQGEKNYDISMLLTGRDMVGDRTGRSSIIGYAFFGKICENRENFQSCGIVEDRSGYGGIDATAHELGHILGAPHDEELKSDTYNAKYCSQKEGYIMSYNYKTKNKIFFSPCSKEYIKNTLRKEYAKCVQNNPAEYRNNRPLPRILPGQLMSLDQQCKNLGLVKCYHEPTTCLDLWCVAAASDGSEYYKSFSNPPAEGTFCGNGKYCLSGECVDIQRYSKKQNIQPVPKKPYNLKATVHAKNPIPTRVSTTTKTPVVVQQPTNLKLASKNNIKLCINGKCKEQEVNDDHFNYYKELFKSLH
ncbi:zinc metalloproteinase/disintegrin-like [Leptopilina heterotoma]|uniref:zinc metalloproteinase/disintegrin-like n=1 Tax=Leptopilina heterotoma TaxID=63436 RepID=UPI001CAA1989|nr:zinc metalloproteinase/disintegrin-like [Leptopilina heterotoma]